MSSSTLQNGGNRTSGFKESLRFFQSQVDKTSVPRANDTTLHSKKSQMNDHDQHNDTSFQNKANLKSTAPVPSVDNILSNVKTLCATRNGRVIGDGSTFPSMHRNNNDNKMQPTHVPVVFQTFDSQHSEGVTRSEQVSASNKIPHTNLNKRPSLLSNFNPTFEPDEEEQLTKSNSIISKSDKELFNNGHNSNIVYDSKQSTLKSTKTDTLTNDFQQKLSFENVNVTSCLKTVSSSTKEQNSVSKNSNESITHRIIQTAEERSSRNVTTNRTFGQCKEKLSQMELNKNFNKITCAQDEKEKSKTLDLQITEVSKKDDDESILEKQSDSFESDYDSQDFVVHKATFPEDYLEAMSEDNYSSVNEDYEVEHPEEQIRGPDIPSPDYVSEEEEEEYHVQHGDEAQYDDVEFIDNTAQYMNDPRRYMYYPDDKELEVIPEEDEDDIEEDEEMYSHEESYKPGK